MTFHIPESFRSDYQPMQAGGLEGWAARELLDCLDSAERDDPFQILRRPGLEPVKDSRNFLAHAEIGQGGRRRVVWIKHFRPTGPVAWAQHAFRSGKAERAWNMAFALLEAGVPTPRPLLGLGSNQKGGGARGLLIVEHAENGGSLRHWLRQTKSDAAQRQALVEALGELLSDLHAGRFRHRDLSGGNILGRQAEDGRFCLCLIDINRMRRGARALGPGQRLGDLERLGLGPNDLEVFFGAYAKGREDLRALAGPHARRASAYRRMRAERSAPRRLLWKARYYGGQLRDWALK